jgi:aryl-alcohol dehydrogenase-like predicted oxidoreductase
MEQRTLGRTGLKLSVLGFGCGAVGGLMVRGSAQDQERAVARALELGIDYFDTAPMYGNGESERNVGRVWQALRPKQAYLGTKIYVAKDQMQRLDQAIAASLDASLKRLGLDSVDVFYLHNLITEDGRDDTLDAGTVIDQVAPVFERLCRQGKFRYSGFTALGDTPTLQRVIDARIFESAQICYNLLNPSAGSPLPAGYPAQDYGDLLNRARQTSTGTIGIRVLAGGALSATQTRHPLGMPVVEPLGSAFDYTADVQRAKRLEPLIEEGHAGSLIEASLRFAISTPALTTVLVGYSTLEQLEYAAASVNQGSLPRSALDRIAALQSMFVGESR